MENQLEWGIHLKAGQQVLAELIIQEASIRMIRTAEQLQ